MIRFAENLNKMITAGLGGAMEAPSTEVAVGHRVVYTEVSGAVVNFETNVIAPVKNLRVTFVPIQEGSGDPSPDNIRPISGRDIVTVWREASYDPSADPALTLQLGQTVYGGTVDVTGGTMSIEWIKRPFTDLVPLPWNKLANKQTFYLSRANALPGINHPFPYPYEENNMPICDTYAYSYSGAQTDYSIRVSDALYIQDPRYQTIAEFRDALARMDGGIVYKLATPQTIQLTSAQLSTLKGQNNVWSDAGDISLEYPYYEETEEY